MPEMQSGPVHPRVCGELCIGSEVEIENGGSSPRVWGTPAPAQSAGCPHRFIPACVGNSDLARCVYCRVTVHPRVCGELIIYIDMPQA